MLRNLEMFQVMSNILSYLKEGNPEELKLETFCTAFEAKFKTYDEVLVLERSNALSDKIYQADLERDQAFRSLASAIRNYVSFPNAEKSAAADQLLRQIEKYGKGVDRLPYLQESGVLSNMLQDLELKENADAIKTLQLDDWVKVLKESNARFDELFMSRETDNSTKVSGQVKEARQALQEEFERLVIVINGYELVYGTGVYGTLVDKINEAIDYAQQQAARRSVRTKEKEEEEEI